MKSAKQQGSEGKNSTDRAERKRGRVARESQENKTGSLHKVLAVAINDQGQKKRHRNLRHSSKIERKGKYIPRGIF